MSKKEKKHVFSKEMERLSMLSKQLRDRAVDLGVGYIGCLYEIAEKRGDWDIVDLVDANIMGHRLKSGENLHPKRLSDLAMHKIIDKVEEALREAELPDVVVNSEEK